MCSRNGDSLEEIFTQLLRILDQRIFRRKEGKIFRRVIGRVIRIRRKNGLPVRRLVVVDRRPGVNVIKLFSFVADDEAKKARVF